MSSSNELHEAYRKHALLTRQLYGYSNGVTEEPDAKKRRLSRMKELEYAGVPELHETAAVSATPNLPKPAPTGALVVVKGDGKPALTKGGQLVSKKTFAVRDKWRIFKVLTGHNGWVNCLAVDHKNDWFVSGSEDCTVKFWELATGKLKLTLPGHSAGVMGVCVSATHPYMFSVGTDKQVLCWDLEMNQINRKYFGHLNGVFCCDLAKDDQLLITGGRDGTVRVWDVRTSKAVHILSSHTHTVHTVKCRGELPDIISGSADKTVKFWDMRAGRTMHTLTHHKKSIRSLALHPEKPSMLITAGVDNIKKFTIPEGEFVGNIGTLGDAIVETVVINDRGVLFSGGGNGKIKFWDVDTGACFQTMDAIAQPGSMVGEAGIKAAVFDQTGLRLITAEQDKTIKIWKETDEVV